MYVLLGMVAWLCFFVGLGVHISTFRPGGCTMDEVWFLQLLALGLFAVAVVKARGEGETTATGVLLRGPHVLQRLFQFTFLYALLNFGWFFITTVGEEKVIRDGDQRYVRRGGQKIALSPEQVREHERKVLRGFSGHWQMFFLGAALILSYSPPGRGRARN